MPNYATEVEINGKLVKTLQDILPTTPGLRLLFVAKTPALVSVKAGHYFQGKQGRMFWKKLINYGILRPTTEYEDESLLSHGFGITDIVKAPRDYGNEPSDAEYKAGAKKVLQLIKDHNPEVVVFVYKRVLDKILRFRFGKKNKSSYGFNPNLDTLFGSRIFVFPMPGTPCTSAQADVAMKSLQDALSGVDLKNSPRRMDLNEKQLREIFNKTTGHCHFCGDPVEFEKRGWRDGDLTGYWEVDHVIQRGKGGDKGAQNCLPACTRCNRLRWHRKGEQVRELLLLGLVATDEIRKGTKTGKKLLELREKRLLRNMKRRRSSKKTKTA